MAAPRSVSLSLFKSFTVILAACFGVGCSLYRNTYCDIDFYSSCSVIEPGYELCIANMITPRGCDIYSAFSVLGRRPQIKIYESYCDIDGKIFTSQVMFLNLYRSKTSWAIALLLNISGDIHQNPGPRPPKYPCGICKKACGNNTKAVACDSCNIWYHTRCMDMRDEIYNTLANVSWHCFYCGLPNFSSALFASFTVPSHNPFSILDNVSSLDL